MPTTDLTADAIVVGGGLAGLVATAELAAAGKHVLLIEQEPEQSLGRSEERRVGKECLE